MHAGTDRFVNVEADVRTGGDEEAVTPGVPRMDELHSLGVSASILRQRDSVLAKFRCVSSARCEFIRMHSSAFTTAVDVRIPL